MGAFERMSPEILRQIASFLDLQTLTTLSRVSRSFWEAAISTLYKNIDLHLDDDLRCVLPKGQDETSLERQKRLIISLGENRSLGGLVSTFQNGTNYEEDGDPVDVTATLQPDLLIAAATNMTSLSCARLTRNVLAARIISEVQDFPHLEDLSIQDLSPFECIWDPEPTSLRRLTWSIPHEHYNLNSEAIRYLTSIVKHTCPSLRSLDIIFAHRYPRSRSSNFDISSAAIEIQKERRRRYQEIQTDDLALGNLQHLGIQYGRLSADTEFLDFTKELVFKNQHSLTSLCITLGSAIPEISNTGLLEMSDKLKNLKDLTLTGWYPNEKLPDFLRTTMSSFSGRLERFSMKNIGSPFTAELGRMFGTWANLKYLCLGDSEMSGGPYGSDGRPDFESYELMEFIKHLPPHLEELHLWIHGDDLFLDEDEDFDPVRKLADPIFRTLRHLHTCDILAYISDVDGGLHTGHPEKAVHYRRLPHHTPDSSNSNNQTKDIWVSTMDCVYQEEYPSVNHKCQTINLGDGEDHFEGPDAKDIWLGGTTGGNPQERAVDEWTCASRSRIGTQRGRQEGPNMTWPGYKGIRFYKYPMYVQAETGEMW